MFKKPFDVKIDAEPVHIDHEIHISPTTFLRAQRLVQDTGRVAILVIAAAALAKTSTEIITHIAKTSIK